MIKRLVTWLRRNEAGQAMVEMALVLPILLILIGGIVDFGWLFYNQLSLTNAAREGARYAAIHHSEAANWKQNAEFIMDNTYVGAGSATATVSDAVNSQICATMEADVPILTGVASTLLGKKVITMTGSCIMRLET